MAIGQGMIHTLRKPRFTKSPDLSKPSMPQFADSFEQLIQGTDTTVYVVTWQEILTNSALSVALGLILAMVYRFTHKRLDYQQHLTQTIVVVCFVVSLFMMIIGSNMARAFGLMGAVSIIRFRTPIKDPRDTAFVFAALAFGVAIGTQSYELAGYGMLFVCGLAGFFYWSNYGARYSDKFILRFIFPKGGDAAAYQSQLQQGTERVTLLNEDFAEGGETVTLIYDVKLTKDVPTKHFLRDLRKVSGVRRVELMASVDH